MDRVGLRDADIGARPLETREPSRGVADAADEPTPEGLAQGRGHRVEAEDVTHLNETSGGPRHRLQRAPVLKRARERLFDEAREAGGKALTRDRPVRVGRGDDVRRLDVRERRAVVEDRPGRLHAIPDGPVQARRRYVRHPERDSELAEHTHMLFSPAAKADQKDVQVTSVALASTAAGVTTVFRRGASDDAWRSSGISDEVRRSERWGA